jgi:hypothetical protein
MLQFRSGAGAVVAGDVRNAVAAVDDALLNGARMCASVIEATQGSNLPVAQSQKLLRSITSGLTSVVEGRGQIVAAVAQMTAIKQRSNFAPESYGCPEELQELGIPTAPAGLAQVRENA